MTPDTLAHAGELILGAEWRRPLARVLGPLHPDGKRESIDPRLIMRWAAGERPIPEWVAPALAKLLSVRAGQYRLKATECEQLAAALRDLDDTGDTRPGA